MGKSRPTYKTTATVLTGKYPHIKIPPAYTLETYAEEPMIITINVTEDVVELFAQRLYGSSVPLVMESEALQGWILKFREDKKNPYDVWNFHWLVNQSQYPMDGMS